MPQHHWQSLGSALRNAFTILAVGALSAISAQAQQRAPSNACGPLVIAGHFGPFDYRTERHRLEIVENFHFTARVEALISGAAGSLEQDLNYTLKSSPNHHRALLSLSRYTVRAKSNQPAGFEWPLECYFERAIRFKGDDPVVRMIYAQFLGQTKRVPAATAQLEMALSLGVENAFTQFNVGLIFFDLGAFDRALAQAHRASALGLKNADLETKLRQAGKWLDLAPSSPSAAASSPVGMAASAPLAARPATNTASSVTN